VRAGVRRRSGLRFCRRSRAAAQRRGGAGGRRRRRAKRRRRAREQRAPVAAPSLEQKRGFSCARAHTGARAWCCGGSAWCCGGAGGACAGCDAGLLTTSSTGVVVAVAVAAGGAPLVAGGGGAPSSFAMAAPLVSRRTARPASRGGARSERSAGAKRPPTPLNLLPKHKRRGVFIVRGSMMHARV
jgi:hypothetical protein